MATQIKMRRGTTSQHSSFTGSEAEVTIDTDKEVAVVHNGSTAGGFPLARADQTLALSGGTISGTLAVTGNLSAANATFSSASPLITGVDTDVDTRIFTIGGNNGNCIIDVDPNGTAGGSLFQVDVDNGEVLKLTSAGAYVTGLLDVSTNAVIDGTALVTGVLTTTAEVVLNGGAQINAAVNVGVDDQGYDFKFFGDTAAKYMRWDASTNSLIFTDDSKIQMGNSSDFLIYHDPDVNIIEAATSDQDIVFKGSDGGLDITPVVFDMSSGGSAVFSGSVAGNNVATQLRNINAGADGDAVSQWFGLARDGGLIFQNAAEIKVIKEQDWTGTASTIDSSMTFSTMLNENLTEQMRLTSGGSVGINNIAPNTALDIIALGSGSGSGVQDALRIRNTGTTGNDAARIQFSSGTSTIGAGIAGLGKALNSASLSFYTGGNTERMALSTTGQLSTTGGLTTTAGVIIDFPQTPATNALYVQAYPTSLPTVFFHRDNTDAISVLTLRHDAPTGTSGTGQMMIFQNREGTTRGTINIVNAATVYATSSDYRLKTDAQPITGATARLKSLKPVNFEWIGSSNRSDGFLAHEAQAVVPEAVVGDKDAMIDERYVVSPATGDIYTPATDEADEIIHSADAVKPKPLEDGQAWRETTEAVMGTRSVPDMQGIDQSKIVPLLTAALQEALTKIEAMEARITALEG